MVPIAQNAELSPRAQKTMEYRLNPSDRCTFGPPAFYLGGVALRLPMKQILRDKIVLIHLGGRVFVIRLL